MGIIKEIFGKVRIYQLRSRVDSRGFMSYVFDENIYDFSIKESRIYSMPKEGTFFGIHYKEESSPMLILNILTIVIRRLGSNFRCLFLKFRIMIRMLLLSFSEPEDL